MRPRLGVAGIISTTLLVLVVLAVVLVARVGVVVRVDEVEAWASALPLAEAEAARKRGRRVKKMGANRN